MSSQRFGQILSVEFDQTTSLTVPISPLVDQHEQVAVADAENAYYHSVAYSNKQVWATTILPTTRIFSDSLQV